MQVAHVSHNTLPTADADHYRLPEDDYEALRRLHDHLRTLAALASPRSPRDDAPGELQLSAAQLAHTFQHLADELQRGLHRAQPG